MAPYGPLAKHMRLLRLSNIEYTILVDKKHTKTISNQGKRGCLCFYERLSEALNEECFAENRVAETV